MSRATHTIRVDVNVAIAIAKASRVPGAFAPNLINNVISQVGTFSRLIAPLRLLSGVISPLLKTGTLWAN